MMIYYIISFILTFVLVFIIRKIALKFNIVDNPTQRKSHSEPKALLGGLAIYLGTVITYMYYLKFNASLQNIYLMLLALAIVIVGIIDDIYDMKAIFKLFFQLLIALITAYVMGGINGVEIYSFSIQFTRFEGVIIEAIWIVALINAFNLIDGLDGLCSGIGIISLVSLFVLSFLNSDITSLTVILILIGSLLAFLYYNFYPSTIFLGDAGSMLIGFFIAILSMESYKTVTMTSMLLLLLISFMPFLDVFLAIIRRKRNKQKAFQADSLHFHHRLMLKGYSHVGAVLTMYIIMTIYMLFAFLLVMTKQLQIKAILTVFLIIITVYVFERLYLLSDKYAYITKVLKKIKGVFSEQK